jgi:hypothetical protein
MSLFRHKDGGNAPVTYCKYVCFDCFEDADDDFRPVNMLETISDLELPPLGAGRSLRRAGVTGTGGRLPAEDGAHVGQLYETCFYIRRRLEPVPSVDTLKKDIHAFGISKTIVQF